LLNLYALSLALSVFPPLPPAFAADGLALSDAPLFAFRNEKALLLGGAQHTISGHFFAKTSEQAFL